MILIDSVGIYLRRVNEDRLAVARTNNKDVKMLQHTHTEHCYGPLGTDEHYFTQSCTTKRLNRSMEYSTSPLNLAREISPFYVRYFDYS